MTLEHRTCIAKAFKTHITDDSHKKVSHCGLLEMCIIHRHMFVVFLLNILK